MTIKAATVYEIKTSEVIDDNDEIVDAPNRSNPNHNSQKFAVVVAGRVARNDRGLRHVYTSIAAARKVAKSF